MNDNDIQKLVSDHPAFWKIRIAASTYPSVSKEVTTFGTKAMLVASEELDEGIVYRIIDAIYSNRERLKSAHPSLSLVPIGEAQLSVAGMPLHPGAVKYFSQH
jgi:TRAP transporter TAXI family solute receptor